MVGLVDCGLEFGLSWLLLRTHREPGRAGHHKGEGRECWEGRLGIDSEQAHAENERCEMAAMS